MREHTVHRVVGILTLAFFILVGLMLLFSHTDTSLTHALGWHRQPVIADTVHRHPGPALTDSIGSAPTVSKSSAAGSEKNGLPKLALPEQHQKTISSVAVVKQHAASKLLLKQHPVNSTKQKPQQFTAHVQSGKVQVERWYLQVASLTSKVSADRMIKELKSHGYRAELKPAQHQNKHFYRLYVGPFKMHTSASSAKKSIDHQFKVKSIMRQVR
jgi:cell division septation protein DedD